MKLLPDTPERSHGPKIEYLPIFCPVVTLTFETQNLISSLSYHSPYFHQISMNSLHALWHYYANKTGMNGQKDRQPKNIMPQVSLKWVEALKIMGY